MSRSHICRVYFLIYLSTFDIRHVESCARFELHSPDLVNKVLTVEENTTTTITFTLTTDKDCREVTNFVIEVGSLNKKDNVYNPQCNIVQKNSSCNDSPNSPVSCTCESPLGRYRFTKTLVRGDNTMWRWTTLNGIAEDEIISFNVTYPAHVISLTVDGHKISSPHVVTQYNKTLQVVCSWENGNPPKTIRLLDKHGVVQESNSVSGVFQHRLSPPSCSSYEIISWEAPGSDKNVSVLLLGSCPPKLIENFSKNLTVTSGQNAEFHLALREHTLSISQCRVFRISAHSEQFNKVISEKSLLCRVLMDNSNTTDQALQNETTERGLEQCRCRVYGAVPFLNMSVSIDNLQEGDTGPWTVKVSNMEGADTMDVWITVQNVPARVNNLTINNLVNQDTVLQNQSAKIVCSWKNGIPPVTVRLLDNHKRLLNKSSSGDISYILTNVQCHDAGVVRCEANSSDRNMSALLLVKCPPSFEHGVLQRNVTIAVGQPIDLRFPFRTHTSQISLCQLKHFQQPGSSFLGHTCALHGLPHTMEKCQCEISGTPPSLTLNVHVYDVTEKDYGPWQVTLSNSVGSAEVDVFFLRPSAGENKAWELWLQVIVTIVPMTCILFAILVVVVCLRLRASRRLVNSLGPFDERLTTLQLHNQHAPGVQKKMSPDLANAIYRQPESSSIAPAAGVDELTQHRFPELPGKESGIKLFCQGADIAQVVLFLRGQSGGQEPRPENMTMSSSSGTVGDSTYSMPESLTARHDPLDLPLKAPSSGTYLTPCDTDYFALPSPVKITQHEYVLATSSSRTMTSVQLPEEPFVLGGHNTLGVNDATRGSNDAVGSSYNESYYSSID